MGVDSASEAEAKGTRAACSDRARRKILSHSLGGAWTVVHVSV